MIDNFRCCVNSCFLTCKSPCAFPVGCAVVESMTSSRSCLDVVVAGAGFLTLETRFYFFHLWWCGFFVCSLIRAFEEHWWVISAVNIFFLCYYHYYFCAVISNVSPCYLHCMSAPPCTTLVWWFCVWWDPSECSVLAMLSAFRNCCYCCWRTMNDAVSESLVWVCY